MTSQGTSIAGIVIGALCVPIWLMTLPLLANLANNDAAGNALSQGFTALEIVVLWVLLAVLAIVGFCKGGMPMPAAFAALILIPASGIASIRALELLSRPSLSPHYWPIVVPAVAPPLIILFCLWAIYAPLRAIVPAAAAGGFVWGAILLLCIGIVPLEGMRSKAVAERDAAIQKYEADLVRVPADAPLWVWTPFLDTPNESRKAEILKKIRLGERRQSDAEIMLDRGDFPLGFLGRLDLTPKQTICDKTRALLRQRAAKLVPRTQNERPYSDVRNQVTDAVAAMRWLVGYGCACDAESQAWQTLAEAYRNPGFETVELRELRDPKELGRTLRETPARFSMLSPKSHLKAWLSFADDKQLREQALAGARALDHRTNDAIEMFVGKYDRYAGATVLKYLPYLDLEATVPLCDSALAYIHEDLSKTYRPKPDDPRSYDELLSRLGGYQPLTALKWLAGHGCSANAELSEAIDLVQAYRDSPERSAMLVSLTQLRRNP